MRRALAAGLGLILTCSPPALACDCDDASESLPAMFGPTTASPAPERRQVRFLVAQAPGDSETASASEVPTIAADIEADRLEIVDDDQGGYLLATGQVKAQYQGFEMLADSLRLDRSTMIGEASGSVRLNSGIYHLRAERIRFDLATNTADATDWQALIEKQGWFGGRRMHLSPTLVYTEDARVSPCVHEDPGYWISGERFEWKPQQARWNLRGQWVSVVVGGVTVLVLPFFTASIGEQAQKVKIKLPDNTIDATVGYDGAQGVFVDSKIKGHVAGVDLTVPVRVMSGRGASAGLQQNFSIAGMPTRLDGNYTQYWWWLPADPGRQGLHSNLSILKDWGAGTRTSMNLGYRVDVGYRRDAEYQVDPGGLPIHRLPEVVTTWPHQTLGLIGFDPSVRGGYLIEDIPNGGASGILQGNLGLSLPGWRPNDFWSTGFYSGANATIYDTRRSQSIAVVGMANTQNWGPGISSSFTLETQPVFTTGTGSPFLHDRAAGVDRILLGANWNIYGPWSLGGGAWWSRTHDRPLALESYGLGDLYLGFRYSVNCLSLGVVFRPPRGAQPFQYLFDYQVLTF